MDIKEYIGSGILEAYVLGALPADEMPEVERNIAQYPELAAEMKAIEETMLGYARSQASEPAAGLQDKIWNAINTNNAAEPQKAKIIPLQPGRRSNLQWAVAAAVALLIGSIVLNLILWNQGNTARQEVADLNSRMKGLDAKMQEYADASASYKSATAMMADTGTQTIVMHTMQPGHPMAATLYWSKTKGEAYVAMNALPMPPSGMQYQLWVIQAGKAVSMGTLPNSMANSPAMQKVPMTVTSGEAFAISLEKEGGNATPTIVYVLGKVV